MDSLKLPANERNFYHMPLKDAIKKRITTHRDPNLELKLQSCGLFDENIAELVDLVNQNASISQLELYGNNIGDEGAKILAEDLIRAEKLKIGYNQIGVKGVESLVKSKIKVLDLNNNGLTDEAGEVIAQHARQEYIFVHNNTLSTPCKQKILERLKQNQQQAQGMKIQRDMTVLGKGFSTDKDDDGKSNLKCQPTKGLENDGTNIAELLKNIPLRYF